MGNLATKIGKNRKEQSGDTPSPPLGVLLTGEDSSGISTIQSKWTSAGSGGPLLGAAVQVQQARRGFVIKRASKSKETRHRTGFLISSTVYGGRGWTRQVFRNHINNLDSIVFVVNSTLGWKDTTIEEAIADSSTEDSTEAPWAGRDYMVEYTRDELKRLLQEDLLQGLPLLVLCNRQDSSKAKPPGLIASSLGLPKIQDRPWKVLGCVSTRGDGFEKGLDWMVSETAKRRAIPIPLQQQQKQQQQQQKKEHDKDEAASDTATETSAEQTVTKTISSKDDDDKPQDALVALLGYDPTSKVADTSTLGRFQPIRHGTSCPFAKASKLWGGRTFAAASDAPSLEEQAKANVKALIEFTRRSDAGEHLDGFCIELMDSQATNGHKTPKELGEAVRRLLTALSDMDPAGEAMMRVKYIGSRGWRFRFAKADFFVTTFAPCYPTTSSRYAFGTGRAFVLLQPELSFRRHQLVTDTPHTNWEAPKTVRDKTRVAFRQAGREYYIPDTIQYPAAEHIVKPLVDKKGAGVVRWWESDNNTGDGSSPAVVVAQ